MTQLALVVHNSSNQLFEIVVTDERGRPTSLTSGHDLAQVLHGAAMKVGHSLTIPIAGPQTQPVLQQPSRAPCASPRHPYDCGCGTL